MRTSFRYWLVPLVAAALAVSSGGAARAAEDRGMDEKVYSTLIHIINDGVDLYNARDYAGCYRLWQGSLKTLRPLLEHHEAWQKQIDAALAGAEGQPRLAERDWVLRRAMDKILDDIHPAPKTEAGPARGAPRSPGGTGVPPGGGTRPPGTVERPGGATRTTTLWDRLGGAKGVGQVIDEIVAVVGKDPKVDFTRGGKYKLNPEQMAKFRQEMIDWVSSKTGGPLPPTGETMKKAHKGMDITDAQFDAFLADVRGVLAKHNLRPEDEKAVLNALEATRKNIVQPPAEKTRPEEKKEEKKPEEKKSGAAKERTKPEEKKSSSKDEKKPGAK
jgi:hemoglobin